MFLPRIRLRTNAAEVALVSPNKELQERLRAAFKGDRRFAFFAVDGLLSKFSSHLDPTSGPSVLIADLDGDAAGAIASIENLRRHRFDGAIVTISDTLDEHAIRGMLHFRISDWLPANAGAGDIIEACERALLAQKRPDHAARLQCYSFVPAAGGVGTTTLAIQTAFILAHRHRSYDSTCLIDLNFQSGVLADYLDLKPGFEAGSVSGSPDRLDKQLLEVMLSRHPTGLALLAPPRSPADCPRVEPEVVASALTVVSETFDNVVVDLPPTWQPWTDDVLAGSDRIYVVTELLVPALKKARELIATMRERLGQEASLKVIVNKSRRRLFGSGLIRSDASELLGGDLAGFVSEDQDLVCEAINRGRPLSAARPSNRVSRELARILDSE
jgi:pilus assembly protein CpaE